MLPQKRIIVHCDHSKIYEKYRRWIKLLLMTIEVIWNTLYCWLLLLFIDQHYF